MIRQEFGSLFQFIRNGMNVKQDKSGNGLPITRIETISDMTVDVSRVGYAGLNEADCDKWLLETGDILFSHINSVEHIGKCAVYRGVPNKLVHGMNLLCLRCEPKKLDPEFAKYLIRGREFRSRLGNFINKAVNQASVSIGNLKTILVQVPPLPEQKRIAEILDRAVALRAKRRAALALLDELTQSIFLDMFGDPAINSRGDDRLPEDWKRCTIGDQITLQRGKDITKSSAKPGDVPVISSGGISFFHNEPFVAGPGVLLGRKESVGKVHYSSVDFWPHDTTLYVKDFKGNVPRYVYFFFTQFPIAQYEASAANPSLNRNNLHPVVVNWPPIELQRRFAESFERVEMQKTALRTQITKLDSLFASLQHRAFRGEL